VKLLGEFLSSPSQQLLRSPLTVALLYNVKAEASPEHASSASQVEPSAISTDPESRSSSLCPPLRMDDIYAEWDTMATVTAVRDAIAERYEVLMIEADEHAYNKLFKHRPAFAFNMSEGLHGVSREAQIPAMLEMLKIPYLGSDPLTLSVCLDKARAKEILSYHGIRTAPFTLIRSIEEFDDARVRFPAMVKPLHEGSSKGIYNSCVVRSTQELETEVRMVLSTYRQPAIIEEFLPGREFTVALLGNGDDVEVLPIVEIKFDALPSGVNPIYSYEAKWIWDTSDKPLEIFTCPAALDHDLQSKIENICREAFRILNCRDWSRIDVRLNADGQPNIIEINPLPGILPKPEDNSCFPKAARAAGISYSTLINRVLDIAMRRTGLCEIPQKRELQAEGILS
jgi:D-alanine-D-alanine ligase